MHFQPVGWFIPYAREPARCAAWCILSLVLSGVLGCTPGPPDHALCLLRQSRQALGSRSATLAVTFDRNTGTWRIAELDYLLPGGPADSDLVSLTAMTDVDSLRLHPYYQNLDRCSGISPNGIRGLAFLRLRHAYFPSNVDEHVVQAISGLLSLEDLQLGISGLQKKMNDGALSHLHRLTKLRRLSLVGLEISDNAMGHIVPLKDLEELRLGWSVRVTDAGLAGLKAMRGLRVIELGAIGSLGLAALAELPSLEDLEIGEYRPASGRCGLTQLRHVKRLRISNIADDNPGPFGLPPELTQLDAPYSTVARLDLQSSKRLVDLQLGLPLRHGANPSEDGYAPLDRKWLQSLPSLRALTLRNPVESDVVAVASLTSLRELSLIGTCSTALGNNGMRALAAMRDLDSLTIVDYYDGAGKELKITEGMDVLPSLPKLHRLELRGFPAVTSNALANIWPLKGLHVLRLKLVGKRMDESLDGMVAQIKLLSNLEELTLSFDVPKTLTDDALRSLRDLKKLRRLDLGSTEGYSDDALASVMRALPELHELKRTLKPRPR